MRPLPPVPSSAAVEVIRLDDGEAVFTQRADVLDRPTWMASVAKAFTLRAALEAGVVDEATRIPCRGRVVLGTRTLQCVHPRFAAPLSAVEALAHSCNAFFAALRLPSGAVAAAFTEFGLPPPPASLREPRLAWIGLDGTRVAPRRTLRAFVALVRQARARGAATDRVLLRGLREAARVGTADAFATAGIDALAKTGTASLGDGTYGGIVVAVAPAEAPAYAVVALGAGIAGRDAAQVAAGAIGRALFPGAPTEETGGPAGEDEGDTTRVRLGRAASDGYRVEGIEFERYVAGVVSAEAPANAPAAVREALAVAARSYARAMRGRHSSEGFDLCDLTHCQAYRDPAPPDLAAAAATQGLVVWQGRWIVPAYHHASCGGAIEAPGAVWGESASANGLVARPDPAGHDHGDAWREEASAGDLLAALRSGGGRGDEVRGLSVARRTASGRVAVVRIDGMVPAEVDGERFRMLVGRHLGWHVLKSSLYDVERTARGYRFVGRGRGHGVGLCVAGAMRLAAGGLDRDRLLAAYFPQARVAPFGPEPRPVRVVLPATSEGERGAVEGLVARHVAAVRRATGASWPQEVVVRFHDSVEAYQRASGQPWWTAGATRGHEVDLLPLDVLRRRGLLERTVRHELAHVATGAALAGRARWVQEGVAQYAAGERTRRAPPSDAPCPSDGEFAAAGSAGDLAGLYARALTCVERAVAAGADWRTIR